MSKFHASLCAICVSAAPLIAPTPAAAAGPATERILTLVVLDDGAGAREDDVAAAQSIVVRVFAQIGARVVWLTRQEFGAAMPAAPAAARAYCRSVIFVHLATAARNPTELGKALTDSNVVWAYVPLIEDAATYADVAVSDFLGYVIAHEIGHLLLGARAHAASGIMASRIDADAVRRRSLGFLPDQALSMQKRLAAWASRDAAGR